MRVKVGLKIPNRLGKMSENLKGGFFDSHCSTTTATFGNQFPDPKRMLAVMMVSTRARHTQDK